MRKIKEVLRLRYVCGLSEREIARSCNITRSTVGNYLRRAAVAGLDWAGAAEITETEIQARLFPVNGTAPAVARPPPDCEYIYNQLRSYKNVNLTLIQLWLEYKEKHADGYQYTQFCEHYRQWRGKLDYCMRQEHRAGEKLFIDYSDGLSIIDLATGELLSTQLFVAVWGASNHTYAEATLNQTLPNWIGSHVRAFEYFGCVPRMLIPDNLKSGVSKACYYEPEVNPTYAEMAEHYGCAVLPARPRSPRDKAKVENGVLVSQRWIWRCCGNAPSTASLNSTPPSESAWSVSMPEPCAGWGNREVNYSRSLTGRVPCRCQRKLTSMPNGAKPGSTSTIISRSTATSTACLSNCFVNDWTSG